MGHLTQDHLKQSRIALPPSDKIQELQLQATRESCGKEGIIPKRLKKQIYFFHAKRSYVCSEGRMLLFILCILNYIQFHGYSDKFFAVAKIESKGIKFKLLGIMSAFPQKMIFKKGSCLENLIDERQKINAVNKKIQDFPDPNTEVCNGIKWGSYKEVFTPAYWKLQYLIHEESEDQIENRLGSDLLEEISACMLGGFGVPSNIGIAAFHRLKQNNLLKPGTNKTKIKEALSEPTETSSGHIVHYRFVNQKSKYLALFLNRGDIYDIPTEDAYELRKWLLQIKGIGLKTASWITRNWLESDKVAIIDIHLLRAGRLTGIFPEVNNINSHYLFLESKFVEFCEKLNVKASIMDAIMWHQMRRSNRFALKMLNTIN